MRLGRSKILGIVGGMGPKAGEQLFSYILENTRAKADQDHLSTILMSFPDRVVDRTAYLMGKTRVNPAYEILRIVQKLIKCEAQVIGIACNTSYTPPILNTIQNGLSKMNQGVRLVNMPEETCKVIQNEYPDLKRVGVLSTTGTYFSQMYENMLEARGYQVVPVDELFQKEVIHKMIYNPTFGLKSRAEVVTEEVKTLFEQALTYFKEHDAELVILGCTELAQLTKNNSSELVLLDSLECLARSMIREASNYIEEHDHQEYFFDIE